MKNLFTIICCSFLAFGSCIFAASTTQKIERTSYEENNQICSPTECYTIEKKLGEGAFGEVFAVTDSQGNEFALKTYKIQEGNLKYNLFSEPEREFSRGQMLNHPNIIKSYDLFTYESPSNVITQNLVLQLVKGQTLYSTPKHSLSLQNAMSEAFQLCDALNYALSFDLMHLDLHPGNVMVTDESEMMVIDLASFFTFKEIVEGFIAFDSATDTNSYVEDRISLSAKTPLASASPEQMTKASKLQRIFNENPTFLKQMQKAKASIEKQSALQRLGSLSAYSSYEPISDDSITIYRNAFSQYYFNMITDMCARLVSKTDLSREEKLELRAEIKKIFWNYEEDLEDGCEMPLEHYYETLKNFLGSYTGA